MKRRVVDGWGAEGTFLGVKLLSVLRAWCLGGVVRQSGDVEDGVFRFDLLVGVIDALRAIANVVILRGDGRGWMVQRSDAGGEHLF